MDDKNLLITNIQRFSLHDGPGIRTTIFMKGCSVQCPWCANPENLNHQIEHYSNGNDQGTYGTFMSKEEIYSIVLRDHNFYGETGGITYSGGEALLQSKQLIPLMENLKKVNVHQCLETALFVKSDLLEEVFPYINIFLVDIKILDRIKCKRVIGGNLDDYYSNISLLFKKQKEVIFRIPIIPSYTDEKENIVKVIEFLKNYRPLSVDIIVGHNLGQKKYSSLNMTPFFIGKVDSCFLEKYKQNIENLGIQTHICKI